MNAHENLEEIHLFAKQSKAVTSVYPHTENPPHSSTLTEFSRGRAVTF